MPTYISARDLKDVFPDLDEFDTKKPVYGWVVDSGSRYVAHDSGLVTVLFVDGKDLGSAQSSSSAVDTNGEWYYDSATDATYYYNSSSNPVDLLMESGEDFATLKTRVMADASKYVDSKLDATLPREQFLLKDGTYDYVIRRLTSLVAAYFLVKGKDPTSAIAEALFEEAQMHIQDLNSGQAKLTFQNTGDASKGIVRKVSVSGSLNIVDTRGDYHGSYDRIKVVITTGGAIGTAKYSVYTKNSDGLKNNLVLATETINGDYQTLAGGLQIRFQGSADNTTTTADDEWEVEVMGKYEDTDNPSIRSVKATRKNFKQFYRV